MVEFEFGKFHSKYVYIVKITNSYIYVTNTRKGDLYLPKGAFLSNYHGRQVSKVKIHKSVSDGYFKVMMIREFSTPRLASINFYDGHIINVEIQSYSKKLNDFQDAENWQSNFSKVVSKLEDTIKSEARSTYVNGTEVFWIPKEEDEFNTMKLNVSGNMELKIVKYVDMQSLGMSTYASLSKQIEVRLKATGNEDMLKNASTEHYLNIKEGKVLAYYPNNPNKDIFVYSPVLKRKDISTAHLRQQHNQKNSEESRVYAIASNDTKDILPNVDFILKSAKAIGEIYGHEATDLLDIPSILSDLGVVNFYSLSEEARERTPVAISSQRAITWILGYIYREKNMSNLLDLSRMFRNVINCGFVKTEQVISLFKDNENSNIDEVKLGEYSSTKEPKELKIA